MRNRKKATGAARLAPVLQNALVIAATYLLLSAMLLIGITPE